MNLSARLRVLLRQKWRNARDLSRKLVQQTESGSARQRQHVRWG